MATTSNKQLSLPTVGGESGTWGGDLNNNVITPIDLMLGGVASIPLSATNYTIGTNAATEVQDFMVKLTGTLLANVTVSSANIGFYCVENNCTGAFTITWQANFGSGPVGSGIVIPQGARAFIVSDTAVGARLCPTWLANLLLAVSGSTPLSVRRTENDTTLRKAISIQSGSGSGNDYSINETGDGSNNVVTVTEQIGSTVIGTKTASAQGFAIPIDLTEIVTPGAPGAGKLRVYAKSGVTGLFLREGASGTETPLSPIALTGAQGLTITNNGGAPDTRIDITASQAILTTAAGAAFFYSGGSNTVDLTVNGSNGLDTGSRAALTWYHLYLISNGSTVASLASLSSTSPTLPGGFTFFMRVGAMQTDGSSNLFRTLQTGNRAVYRITGSTNTADFPFRVSGSNSQVLTAFQVRGNNRASPPTAAAIIGIIKNPTANGTALVAPNNSYNASVDVQPVSMGWYAGQPGGTIPSLDLQWQCLLESDNVFWSSNASGATFTVHGWTDSVNAV